MRTVASTALAAIALLALTSAAALAPSRDVPASVTAAAASAAEAAAMRAGFAPRRRRASRSSAGKPQREGGGAAAAPASPPRAATWNTTIPALMANHSTWESTVPPQLATSANRSFVLFLDSPQGWMPGFLSPGHATVRLAQLNAATGDILSVVDVDTPAINNDNGLPFLGLSALALDAGGSGEPTAVLATIFFAGGVGRIALYDAVSGDLRWNATSAVTAGNIGGNVEAGCSAGLGLIYVMSYSTGSPMALNATTGAVVWQAPELPLVPNTWGGWSMQNGAPLVVEPAGSAAPRLGYLFSYATTFVVWNLLAFYDPASGALVGTVNATDLVNPSGVTNASFTGLGMWGAPVMVAIAPNTIVFPVSQQYTDAVSTDWFRRDGALAVTVALDPVTGNATATQKWVWWSAWVDTTMNSFAMSVPTASSFQGAVVLSTGARLFLLDTETGSVIARTGYDFGSGLVGPVKGLSGAGVIALNQNQAFIQWANVTATTPGAWAMDALQLDAGACAGAVALPATSPLEPRRVITADGGRTGQSEYCAASTSEFSALVITAFDV